MITELTDSPFFHLGYAKGALRSALDAAKYGAEPITGMARERVEKALLAVERTELLLQEAECTE